MRVAVLAEGQSEVPSVWQNAATRFFYNILSRLGFGKSGIQEFPGIQNLGVTGIWAWGLAFGLRIWGVYQRESATNGGGKLSSHASMLALAEVRPQKYTSHSTRPREASKDS